MYTTGHHCSNRKWKQADVNCKMLARWTHECQVQGNSLQHRVFTTVSKPFDLESEFWYIDGSSYYKDGKRISGFAGACVKDGKVQRQFSYLCRARSAQYVEIAAFLQVLIELRDDGIVNIASALMRQAPMGPNSN